MRLLRAATVAGVVAMTAAPASAFHKPGMTFSGVGFYRSSIPVGGQSFASPGYSYGAAAPGYSVPSAGYSFSVPSAGMSLAPAGYSFPSAGYSFPSAGQSFPSAGYSFSPSMGVGGQQAMFFPGGFPQPQAGILDAISVAERIFEFANRVRPTTGGGGGGADTKALEGKVDKLTDRLTDLENKVNKIKVADTETIGKQIKSLSDRIDALEVNAGIKKKEEVKKPEEKKKKKKVE